MNEVEPGTTNGADTGVGVGAPRPIEVELKFRILDMAAGWRVVDAEEVGGLPALGPAKTAQVEDRYVDTADGALARAGFAARLRQAGGGTLVTVKSTARPSIGRVHRREELEGPADRARGPHEWPASAARSLVLELAGDAPLLELVTIRQLRRKREFGDGQTVVELSLDEVDVVARGRVVERFTELEAELLRGDEARLAAISNVLAADPAFVDAGVSKLEAALTAVRTAGRSRGDRSVRSGRAEAHSGPAVPEPGPEPVSPEPQRIVVGKTPGVLRDDLIAEAGRKVLRFHLARMIAKEPGTRTGTDPEDLHQMRVATRRMRAAFRVFEDGFRPERTRRHRRGLRRVAARLGAVRDLDVLIAGLEAYRDAQPEEARAGLEPLLSAWRTRRDEARVLLLRELDSESHRRFVAEFREFVLTGGAGARVFSPTEPHRVRDTAPSRIWAAFERVRAYEPVLRWADVATLHEIRIAGKWLRYTIEFLREALGPETPQLVARVVALQDHLGLLHDADVAASFARAFLAERAGTLAEAETAAIGRYLLDRERALAHLRRTVGPAWRGVAGPVFRRRLGRAVAAL